MAWITPVTDRAPDSRTTHTDMNRIANNIKMLGGNPVKQIYLETDIVTAEEWEYICEYANAYNRAVTRETTYNNFNIIEQTLLELYQYSRLVPANDLFPSTSLYPGMEV